MFTVYELNAKVVTCTHGQTGTIFQAGLHYDLTKKISFFTASPSMNMNIRGQAIGKYPIVPTIRPSFYTCARGSALIFILLTLNSYSRTHDALMITYYACTFR